MNNVNLLTYLQILFRFILWCHSTKRCVKLWYIHIFFCFTQMLWINLEAHMARIMSSGLIKWETNQICHFVGFFFLQNQVLNVDELTALAENTTKVFQFTDSMCSENLCNEKWLVKLSGFVILTCSLTDSLMLRSSLCPLGSSVQKYSMSSSPLWNFYLVFNKKTWYSCCQALRLCSAHVWVAYRSCSCRLKAQFEDDDV